MKEEYQKKQGLLFLIEMALHAKCVVPLPENHILMMLEEKQDYTSDILLINQWEGEDAPSMLRAICSVCNEGASNLTLNRPQAIKLIAQVRRAPTADQLDILKWVVGKFPKQTEEVLKNRNK